MTEDYGALCRVVKIVTDHHCFLVCASRLLSYYMNSMQIGDSEEWISMFDWIKPSGDSVFNEFLNQFFKCKRGAYSIVTKREVHDHQITVTANEKSIFNIFFKNYTRGQVAKDGSDEKTFKLFPNGEEIRLNVNYPKAKGNELRLYIRGGTFLPAAGAVWFVFERQNAIWIGSLDHISFGRALDGLVFAPSKALVDLTDDEFTAAILMPPAPGKEQLIIERTKRNPATARAVLAKNPSCEILPKLPTFISKSTGKVFLEAHHLVPMSLQSRFESSLDVAENICALNPYSHRMLHHAKMDEIEQHLETLAKNHSAFLKQLGIDANYVKECYA